jgi:aminodeoxyfutalosine deaminase
MIGGITECGIDSDEQPLVLRDPHLDKRDGHLHLEATLRLQAVVSQYERQPSDDRLGRFERVLSECMSNTAAGGAREAFLRFNPLIWVQRGVPLRTQIGTLAATVEQARTQHALAVTIYVTLKREASAVELRTAVKFALEARKAGVAGVDISRSYDVTDLTSRPGNEADATALRGAVVQARDGGLEVACHCGWYDSSANLEEAIELGAVRIGHALALVDRPDLVTELVQRRIVVEVCPTSYERRVGRSIAMLPVADWFAAGVALEVGTDHPLALGTDLHREVTHLRAAVPGWGTTETRGVTR